MVTVVYVYNSILKTSFIVNFLQYFFRYLETFKPDIFMVVYMPVIYLLIVNDCEKKYFSLLTGGNDGTKPSVMNDKVMHCTISITA